MKKAILAILLSFVAVSFSTLLSSCECFLDDVSFESEFSSYDISPISNANLNITSIRIVFYGVKKFGGVAVVFEGTNGDLKIRTIGELKTPNLLRGWFTREQCVDGPFDGDHGNPEHDFSGLVELATEWGPTEVTFRNLADTEAFIADLAAALN